MMASFVFLLCYTVSTATYYRVRPSLFEVLFNLLCCALYIAASTLLLTSVFTELYYLYHTVSAFSAYPALTAVYVMGFAAGVLHLIDAILAFIFWRQQSAIQQQQWLYSKWKFTKTKLFYIFIQVPYNCDKICVYLNCKYLTIYL